MSADPARRALAAAGKRLTAAGFVRRVWPAGQAHIYEHITRQHRITVILHANRGHQVVIYAHWDPDLNTWICDREYGHDTNGHPYDIPTAVQHALELAKPERSAA